jgi:hypothetical protein
MRALSFGSFVFASPTEIPSTVMMPSSKGYSPLTHLIKVDFPEPEGPHTTTTSPLATSALHLLSTCTLPYHLLTLLIEIIGRSANDGDAMLKAAHTVGCGERNDKVDDRGE